MARLCIFLILLSVPSSVSQFDGSGTGSGGGGGGALDAIGIVVDAAKLGFEICDRMKPDPPREYQVPPDMAQKQQIYDRPRETAKRHCLNPDEQTTFTNPADCKELCDRPCLREGMCFFCPPGHRKTTSAQKLADVYYENE